MEIDVKTIINDKSKAGQIFWVCDYRRPDINKKPIRSVKPTRAMLVSSENAKKRIYYSLLYFSEIGKDGNYKKSSVISIFDNTGYRTYKGEPLAVFDNKTECINFYNKQCDDVISKLKEKRRTALSDIDTEIKNTEKLKKQGQENGK